MGCLERLRRFLDDRTAGYRVREHPAARTVQELRDAERGAGATVLKVVLVVVGEAEFAMLVLPASGRVDRGLLRRLFPGRRVRVAHEEEFTPLFPDCEAGAMPAFGNLYGVPVYVDERVPAAGPLVMLAGSHRHTLEISSEDFRRLARPVVASFSGAEPREG